MFSLLSKCKKKRKQIITDIESMFSDYERLDDDGYYEPDKSKNSYSNTTCRVKTRPNRTQMIFIF